MSPKTPLFAALVFIIVFSSFSVADQVATLVVWIEGTIGVGAEYENALTMEPGGTNGTWVTIHNTGNIRDVLRMEGSIEDPTCSSPGPACEYRDWIKFSFKCGESIGICDDVPSSEMKYVDDIQLTPRINQTQFYLEVTSYKVSNPLNPPNITITGYSLTNLTKQTDFIEVTVITKSPTGTYESADLPGISPFWIPLLLSLAGLAFYKKSV